MWRNNSFPQLRIPRADQTWLPSGGTGAYRRSRELKVRDARQELVSELIQAHPLKAFLAR